MSANIVLYDMTYKLLKKFTENITFSYQHIFCDNFNSEEEFDNFIISSIDNYITEPAELLSLKSTNTDSREISKMKKERVKHLIISDNISIINNYSEGSMI